MCKIMDRKITFAFMNAMFIYIKKCSSLSATSSGEIVAVEQTFFARVLSFGTLYLIELPEAMQF